MGQQQLLLVVLGVIIVGISIALMISLFTSNAAEQKRDILINECANLANDAIAYYRRTENFGGGGKSFIGWAIPPGLKTSENGSFVADVSANQIKITATGNELVTDKDTIKVEVTILPDSYSTEIIN